MTLEVVDLCCKHNIILFCLPPHTTHALQPLDVAVFKSLKDHFSKSVRAVAFTKKDFIVSKREFSRVLRSPFECAFSIPNIKSGFRKSGIYPFNPDAVEKAKMIPSTLHSSSLNESSSDSSTPYPSSQSSCPPSQSSVASTSTEVASTSGISSVTSASTPSPTVSPWCSQSSLSSGVLTSTPIDLLASCSLPVTPSSSGMSSPIVNPLASAGLVQPDLADILSAPSEDAAVAKKRTKRITGARALTANEYVKMLREDDRKKKEAAELKQK